MPKIMYRPNPVPPPFVPPTPVANGLLFTASQAGSSVAFKKNGSVTGVSLSYSLDNGQTWNPYTFGQSLNLTAVGDSVMFKGDNSGFSVDFSNFIQAEMIGKIAASGSLAYLLDSNGSIKPLPSYCFANLFAECSSLVQAPDLPAITLNEFCYARMFYGCTSLVKAPALPATTMKDYCYSYMFSGCTSLVQAPALPATTLAYACYTEMFLECSSLSQAPALPATTLIDYCYSFMFSECSSLVQTPILPATTLAPNCYAEMFNNCTSLVQVSALPATSLALECYTSMFAGCSSLTQAPALPAITLIDNCYNSMFKGCNSLNYVQCNATDISAYGSLLNWLENVSASGTFKKNAYMNDWPRGASGIPENWTIEDI